ncbi:MAG TPA: hypothetical protein VJU61_09730, partial [Polyangiaceae bacterium]|nr:hypothetical protein [Polyangiaceae bacterium]
MVRWPPTSNVCPERYVLRGGGPPAACDEVEHRARLTIEVVLLWQGDVLGVSHLSPPGSFFVGGSPADVALPPEWLGSERLCVAVGSRSEISAVVPAHARCWRTLPDGSTRLFQPGSDAAHTTARSPSTERLLPLGLGHRAHLCLGELEIQVAAVPAGRAPARRGSIGFDTTTLAYFGLSSLSVAGAMAVLSLLAPPTGLTPDEQTVSERLYLLRSYLQASAEREQDNGVARAETARAFAAARPFSPPPQPEAPLSDAQAGEAPLPPSDDSPSVPADARERRAQIEEARSFGIIGLLSAHLAALADPQLRFRREPSSEDLATMHQLFNPEPDPLSGGDGPGGLALLGTGLGGGGRADIVPLNAVRTIGGGEGQGL